ncbi:S-adenosylmethionine synthetase MetK, MetX [Helicobacter sp. NHP19-012]|uniref:S-adenosylmethionine synthase n=1 Tax=Helicobacter gastrofelis TaxID=2849642 RepID=A0ABM7SFN5_9HELI|nr:MULTISPECIES: methionine adenosyltransferase [unclassified Helicobacter]BCZ18444.1 S-adenosylmethionine synthetase MetK, MetX [Helicobacter sp. NHP19-012]GMB95722.1 S-adenosylmethionine synthetase MetK, MetX [Helicobacter sp. NHP22-001]
MSSYLFTSESVTEGHPDKMADQISDAVLDYIIERDKNARVACETLLANGFCIITGELKTKIYAPMQEIARGVVKDIGYTDALYGFDYRSAAVLNGVGEQSPDINQGVDRLDGEVGAGDQGIMFGYACNETPQLMPLAVSLAHAITLGLANARKSATLPFLRPDGKAQVTIRYEGHEPVGIDTIVVSTQHSPEIDQKHLREAVIEEIVYKVLPKEFLNDNIKYHINPTGKFVIGGPQGDAGLTGRKIIVDTYGGSCPHGGGAFSGKDPSKVDRSAAYMARYIAKNLVASGVCKRATVQLAYAIGIVDPVSVYINTHHTSIYTPQDLEACVRALFKLTPKGIIESLDLLRPIYRQTAAYGHFGREGFSWEQTDKATAIADFLSK